MATIGVKIEIINGPRSRARGQAGDCDLDLYGGYPVQDPNALTQPLSCGQSARHRPRQRLTKDGGSNLTDWCNKEFDALMEQARTTADQYGPGRAVRKAQDIFLEEVPIQVNYVNANAFAGTRRSPAS